MSSSGSWQLAADAFLAGKNAKGKYKKHVFGMYLITESRNTDGTLDGTETLAYRTSDGKKDIVAVRTLNGVFGNSSILPMIGRTMAWGNANNNRDQTPIQMYIRSKAKMIPMYQLKQSGFNMGSIKVIDQGKEETVTVKQPGKYSYETQKDEPQPDLQNHFTGAMLLECKKADGKVFQFLFDIDRNEIAHKRFNAFFVELQKPVKNIDAAYKSLKPKQVLAAELKGLNVKRQGEWFFIPTKYKPKGVKKDQKDFPFQDRLLMAAIGRGWGFENFFSKEEIARLTKKNEKLNGMIGGEKTLRAGQNRPNTVERGIIEKGITYVQGKVKHTGREHEDLELDGWHIAIPNTSVQSWQLDGKID